jgi:hypothetical protein
VLLQPPFRRPDPTFGAFTDTGQAVRAITIGADYFLTTDKAILRKMVKDERIQVRDPVEFLGEYTGADDENGY